MRNSPPSYVALATYQTLRAFLLAELDIPQDLFQLLLRSLGAEHRLRIQRARGLQQQRYPDQDIIYFADRASFPYGAKNKAALHEVTAAAIARLRDMGAEAVLVASNAPTITVLDDIKQAVGGPILGV